MKSSSSRFGDYAAAKNRARLHARLSGVTFGLTDPSWTLKEWLSRPAVQRRYDTTLFSEPRFFTRRNRPATMKLPSPPTGVRCRGCPPRTA
jgi:hypothetical protein